MKIIFTLADEVLHEMDWTPGDDIPREDLPPRLIEALDNLEMESLRSLLALSLMRLAMARGSGTKIVIDIEGAIIIDNEGGPEEGEEEREAPSPLQKLSQMMEGIREVAESLREALDSQMKALRESSAVLKALFEDAGFGFEDVRDELELFTVAPWGCEELPQLQPNDKPPRPRAVFAHFKHHSPHTHKRRSRRNRECRRIRGMQ